MRPTPTFLITVLTTCMLDMPAHGMGEVKLLPSDGAAGDRFGRMVAIGAATAISGSPFDDDNGADSGSVYLFDAVTGQQQGKLLAKDGKPYDLFGWSVAVSGTIAIVGAVNNDGKGAQTGSAYLFDTTTGGQLAKLMATDGANSDWFGDAVAISGTTAIVGARFDDDNGSNSGSAYLFDTTTGVQIAKLLPSDGAANDQFGSSVAISGATVIVGSPVDQDNGMLSGSAYLFDATTGQQLAKLLPQDGSAGDTFGRAVAIHGTTAIVGAEADDDNGTDSGSAYLFDTATGQELAKLLPGDGAFGDNFGSTVAIDGSVAIVGAWRDDDKGSGSGSAYLFDAVTGAELTKLVASDGGGGDYFGRWGVAIRGTTAMVGSAFDDDNGLNSGSAYLFDGISGQRGPQWTDLGNSLAGSAGLPLLRGWGDLSQGSSVTLDLINTAPGSPTVLIAGLGAWYLSYKGGVMVPSPDLLFRPGSTDPAGRLTLQYPGMPSLPTGTTLFLQYWLPDPLGPRGWAASNAVSQTSQ